MVAPLLSTRVTALPATLAPDTLYLVKAPVDTTARLFVADSNGVPVEIGGLDAATQALALSLTAIAPTGGIATNGQTTVTAPAPVPADKPWWVRVNWAGSYQLAGVDFTTDGTTTIHLNFPMSAGDKWWVEQVQRAPA